MALSEILGNCLYFSLENYGGNCARVLRLTAVKSLRGSIPDVTYNE